jgi:sugar transferase EpsL
LNFHFFKVNEVKRIFDTLFIFFALPLIVPVGLLVALLVALKLGRPVLFIQARPGIHSQAFRMYKFRTMTDERDADGNLLPDYIRLTRFGRWLRSTSLDELPELLNVLRGEMSLVGPRPLLMQYLPLYNDHQRRRHEVRPGITGWAQINGRNAISWEQKFDLDVWYVDNRSLWLDIRILFLTIWKVFKRDGISQEGEATAAPFTGSRPVETSTERH